MGFSKELIDKYAPGAECIEPMKVWKIPEGKEYRFAELCNNGEYFAQVKKDGYWYQFEKTDTGECYLFSRTVSATTGILTEKSANVPHIVNTLKNIPNGTILIGEIYYPGKTSKSVTRIMGCLPEKAIKRQEEEGHIHFYVHDIIKYKGESLLSTGAYDRYDKLVELFTFSTVNFNPCIELAEIFLDNIQEETAKALESGEEGMVLKKKDCPYSPGKRPAWHNLKIKKIDYLDAICIGFCDATKDYTGKEIETWPYWYCPKTDHVINRCQYGNLDFEPVTKGFFYGWKTAIKIGAFDENGNIKEIGTVASGLTDELRQDFAENPDKYLNKVVKLQCMELDSKEKTLRHAFFKGFHEDKNAEECTLISIFT
jgi:ATP-dependent DNA ligase